MSHGSPDGAYLSFATSGQSGTPVVWRRTAAQLHAEAELMVRTVAGGAELVLNYAPTRHLYGRIFGEELPRRLGVPVRQLADEPLSPPDIPPGSRVLVVCLPSTWELLRRTAERLRAATVTAVHSTAPPPDAARRVADALSGSTFRAVQILGSTETGGVAHRPLAPRSEVPVPWRLFPDYTLVPTGVPGAEQPLRVAGPRLARRGDEPPPTALTLDDLVRPLDERTFELLGRGTRMIKVNGRRVHLARVEDAVRAAFPHADVVCVPRHDPLRAEHYDLYYASGPVEVPAAEVRRAVGALPGVPVPREVRRVAEIPRSAAGKVRIDRLPSGRTGGAVAGGGGGVVGRAH
ncbi:class I adenylate-forming enzyme family protein [Streptomyces sp. NPDC049881]|uniref:class I adenylate-forming enzyme family protein n=1 Tax=unclassified Streptomyces TaxID=2593676 RepID=UPI0034199FD0